MDLSFTDAENAWRSSIRAWLRDNVPARPLPSLETAAGFEAHREWERTLHGAGYSVVSWPEKYGGRDASLLDWLIFEEEYYAAGAPGRVSQNGIFLLAPTLFTHGTQEQCDRILPRMAAGTDVWAQAWSEPNAGSDLASLRSTAVRTEGGWLLYGQKTWSSRAAFADWAFGLFRTDPDAERHRGMTYFMFPLHADGVSVRPIGRIDGKPGFAELFLDGAFVPDHDVIGEMDRGWKAAMSTASSERGLSLRSPGRYLASADRLVELWRGHADPSDTALRDRVADAWIAAQAYQLYTFEAVTRVNEGESLGAESSMNKVFWSELDVDLHETALDILGPAGELADEAPDAAGGGSWMDGYLFSLAGPIYAGTNEIQRNVIAERVLGLPRERRA